VVLWELLTGKRLFKGETDLMTLRLVKDCQVPFPSQLNPKLPPGLDEVVMRALDANPQKRFPDCGAFRLALEDYIIQMRLQASGAHLAAYLRGLYAERISLEEDPTALDQLSEDSDLDSKGDASRSSHRSGMQPPGTPSRSPGHRGETRSRRAVDALVGPAPTPRHEPPPARGTVSLAALPPSSSRFPKVAVVVGGAVTLLLAGTAVVFLRPLPSEGALPPKVAVNVPPPPPGARPVPPPPPPSEPPRAPQPVQLVLASEPQGAQVHVDGTALGKTPRTLTLAPDAPPVQVTVTLEGYESATRTVSAADGPTVQVALERRAAATGPKAPPVKKPPAPPSLGIKTGR
jgi:serine/threonine protein kinase